MSFEKQLQTRVAEVEEILKKVLPKATGNQKNIMEAMEYSLMAGGKRIRPILMKESFELFKSASLPKSQEQGILPGDDIVGEACSVECKEKDGLSILHSFMVAIEMIHTYSLVHDDLPAMDNDEYRRGRKTTHVVYGEDMGILTGDALLNYAFETALSTLGSCPSKSPAEELENIRIGQALKVLSEKAGIFGMIGGQVIDMESEGNEIEKEVLDEIYMLKTAALMEAAMMIGGILGGASKEEVKVLESIARNVGIAFQIQDDILDVTSTLEVLGKATHSDEKNQKTTYVTLKSLAEAKEDVKMLSSKAIEQLRRLGKNNSFLEELLLYLIYREY